MKKVFFLVSVLALSACGVKEGFTNEIRTQYNLTSEKELKKVQFYTSETIILTRSKASGNSSTDEDGTLVSSQNSEQDRIIIPVNTKCICESVGAAGEIFVRFEVGPGKLLPFTERKNQNNRYYFSPEWIADKGGKINYGNEVFYATQSSGTAYLMIKRKNLQKTKRRDRVVKGMKV